MGYMQNNLSLGNRSVAAKEAPLLGTFQQLGHLVEEILLLEVLSGKVYQRFFYWKFFEGRYTRDSFTGSSFREGIPEIL